MSFTHIVCPSCNTGNSEKSWNMTTKTIVNGLNGNIDLPITLIEDRVEGCFFRCPNPACEDEVVTNEYGYLSVQD